MSKGNSRTVFGLCGSGKSASRGAKKLEYRVATPDIAGNSIFYQLEGIVASQELSRLLPIVPMKGDKCF